MKSRDPMDRVLDYVDRRCPDLKVIYTLFVCGDFTLEVADKRTNKSHTRMFPAIDSNVTRWLDELQKGV